MKTLYSGFQDPLTHAPPDESLIAAWSFPLNWLFFAVSYFSLAYLCLETRDTGSLSSTIWLPAGLTLGVLSRSSLSRWPLWIISAGLLHVLVSFMHDRPIDIALIFAFNDLMTLSLSAYIWKIFIKHSNNHRRELSMIFFIALVFLGSILGGISTIYSLNALTYPTVFLHFVIWSISNATGCLAVAPIFLLNNRNLYNNHLSNKPAAKENNTKKTWQLLTILLILISTLLIFIPSADAIQRFSNIEFALYFFIGLILLCSIFLTAHQLSFIFIAIALIISLATLYNHGPFSTRDYSANEFITDSQLYLLITYTFGLLFHSLIHHLQKLKKRSQQQVMLISGALTQQRIYYFSVNITTQCLIWCESNDNKDISPFNLVTTPAQLLGRMHTDDRLLLSAWFNGATTLFLQPFSYSVRLFLDNNTLLSNSNTFTGAHLALINVYDEVASLALNGVIIISQNAIFKPIGTKE